MMGERNPAQKQMEKPVYWADLPKDVMRIMMEKLSLSERLPLSLVCKTWHESSLEIQNVKEEQFLPWVMTYGLNICKLRDPSVQASHHIVKEANHLLGASACASRQGWVLFSQPFREHPAEITYYTQYFLYNPFTDEVIKFPKLKEDIGREVTFTERPGSPSCMIIGFSHRNRKLNIQTCRPGDESWRINEYDCGCDCVLDVACIDDFVYCAFLDGGLQQLGVFNIKQHTWKIFSGSIPQNVSSLVVAFNGVLLLLTMSRVDRRLTFWRFDLLEKKWFAVGDKWMKKQVIFSCCTSFTVPAARDAGQSAGLVYYFNPYTPAFTCYSFDSIPPPAGQVGQEAYRWLQEGYQWMNGDYKCLQEDYKLRKIWIQPPSQRMIYDLLQSTTTNSERQLI